MLAPKAAFASAKLKKIDATITAKPAAKRKAPTQLREPNASETIKTSKAKAVKGSEVGDAGAQRSGAARKTPKASKTKTFASYPNTAEGLRYVLVPCSPTAPGEGRHAMLVFRSACGINVIYRLSPLSLLCYSLFVEAMRAEPQRVGKKKVLETNHHFIPLLRHIYGQRVRYKWLPFLFNKRLFMYMYLASRPRARRPAHTIHTAHPC